MHQNFAIIDIETTGANRSGNKITEIAIIITDGQRIIDEYSTLINPERSIPQNITYLTGITNQMVADKPRFFEVAKKIVELTEDCIFVAHNVFFDYNFIKAEFAELGFQYNRNKLCTVRLARKAFPGLKSYSLGNLTTHFDIPLKNHHRALDDAKSTFELFKLIKEKLPQDQLKLEKKTTVLPPHLSEDQLENLPEAAGTYYFYSKEGDLLYIGKSKNIKKRVLNHFRPDIKRKKDLQLKLKIAAIDAKPLGNELAALLWESQEIKHLKPPFNTALRANVFKYHVILQDFKLKISTQDEASDFPFKSKAQAQRAIDHFHKKIFGIPDHEYLESGLKKYRKILGDEAYLDRLNLFFSQYHYPHKKFYLKLKGRISQEDCLLQIYDEKLTGLWFVSENDQEFLPIDENREHRKLVLDYIQKHRLKIRPGSVDVEDFSPPW